MSFADVDLKQPLLDVEAASPAYPLEDPGELVVGQKRGWFRCNRWRNRGCCKKNRDGSDKPKRCIARRVFRKFLFFGFLFLAVKTFMVCRAYRHIEDIQCTPLEAGSLKETYTLPYSNATRHIAIHASFSAPDVRIIKDDSISADQVTITVEGTVPTQEPSEVEGDDGKVMTCVLKHSKLTGILFLSKDKDAALPSLTKTTIRVPSSVVAPSVKFLGPNEAIKDSKLRKWIGWWLKRHEKNE